MATPLAEPVGHASASLRAFRAGYWFGGWNGLTWMMALGTPMVLMTEALGGSTLQVGLASSFVLLLHPVQIVATSSLRRLGFQRQMVLAWSVRAVFLFVPSVIAWMAPETPEPWMANAMVLSVFGFCFCRAFGVAAHIPWFAGILPDGLRGRYFATDGAITSGVGVVALLTCAGLFAALPLYPAFRVIYGIAMIGSVLATWNLTRLPSGPEPAPAPVHTLAGEAWRFCTRPGLFRQFLFLTLVGSVVTSSFSAFSAYYLKTEAGLEPSRIVAFVAMQFAGQIVGTFSIRLWIDRVALRYFFQLGNVLLIAVYLYWLALLSDPTRAFGLFLAYPALGAAFGLSNVAHVTLLPELSPPEKRPVSVAVFGAVSGLLSGLGPILWGLALRSDGDTPGVDGPSFRVFLMLGVALSCLTVWLLESLPDARAGAARRSSS